MRLRTVCTNQRGEDVLTGEALVMPSRTPVRYEPETARAPWTALPWTWAADGVAALGVLGLLTPSTMSWWLPRGVKGSS